MGNFKSTERTASCARLPAVYANAILTGNPMEVQLLCGNSSIDRHMPLVANMYSGKSNLPGVFRVLEAPRLHISYVGSTIAFAYHQNVLKRSKGPEEETR